jgi:hypothetical protein
MKTYLFLVTKPGFMNPVLLEHHISSVHMYHKRSPQAGIEKEKRGKRL